MCVCVYMTVYCGLWKSCEGLRAVCFIEDCVCCSSCVCVFGVSKTRRYLRCIDHPNLTCATMIPLMGQGFIDYFG